MKSEYKVLREVGGSSFEEKVLEAYSKGWRALQGGFAMSCRDERIVCYSLIMKRSWIRRLLATD